MTTKKNKGKLVANISAKISNYIQSELDEIKHDDSKWKEHYEMVMRNLEYEIKNAKDIILDYKEENFTVNIVEMEGYLRGIITMYNQFKNWEKDVEDKED